MKSFLTPAYVFDPAARTLDLSAIAGFNVKRLAAVINLTAGNTIIYAPLPGLGTTAVAGGILTLAYDTTGMNAGDVLQIVYDDPTPQAVSGPFTGAQLRATPVEIVNPVSLEERFAREGEAWASYGSATTSWGGTNTNLPLAATSAVQVPTIGKILWAENFHASVWLPSSAVARIQAQLSGDANGRFTSLIQHVVMESGNSITVPVRRFVRPHEIGAAAFELRMRELVSGTAPVSVASALGVTGYKLTDDLNWGAAKTILVPGDSILNGTGPSKTANMWIFKVRDYFIGRGEDVRVVLKSLSGSTTSEHKALLEAGYYDICSKPNLIPFAVSVNDAGNAVSDGTYVANITAVWNYVKVKWPEAVLVICGPTPVENNTTHTRSEGLRAAAAAYVTSVNDPRLKYVNLGTAFDRTNASFYASSDAAGSRVHPNDAGHAAIYTTIEAWTAAEGLSI